MVVAILLTSAALAGCGAVSAVAKARYAGLSWTEIGKAAQVTRQTAHEKWRDAV